MNAAERDLIHALIERTKAGEFEWRKVSDYYDLEFTTTDGRWFGVRLEPIVSVYLRGGHGLVTIHPEMNMPGLARLLVSELQPIHDRIKNAEESDYMSELRSARQSVLNHQT